jgi:hypothetical protein
LNNRFPYYPMKTITHILSLATAVGALLVSDCATSPSATAAEPSAAVPSASGPVEMKLKWNVGKKYVQRMEMNQTMEMNLPDAPAPTKQEMKMVQIYTITVLRELAGGGRELDLEFTNLKMDSTMGEVSMMKFDSDQDAVLDAANPASPMLRKMIGAHIKYLTGADGKVEKVEGYEDLIARMSGTNQPQMQAMVRSMFSEDNLKEMFMQAQVLPDLPVNRGDSWPVKLEVNLGPMGIMNMDLNYTFRDWEQHESRRCTRLEYTGVLSLKSAASDSPVAMKMDNGRASGNTWFDPGLGMVVDTAGDHAMKLNITSEGKDMSMQVMQKMNVKLLEVTDAGK